MWECIRTMLNILKKTVITRKTFSKILVILQLSAILPEKVETFPKFEQWPPTYIKKGFDTKTKRGQRGFPHQISQ